MVSASRVNQAHTIPATLRTARPPQLSPWISYHAQGTAYDDVVCEQCPYEKYRGTASADQNSCQPWRNCDDTEFLKVEGTATTDHR